MENIKITAVCNNCGQVTEQNYDEHNNDDVLSKMLLATLLDLAKDTGFKRVGNGKWLCPDCYEKYEASKAKLDKEFLGE